ncbi:phosphatidylglycerophosphatase A [Candidatus Enterovibrio escicola]|uniref:phosphatidylglycerophosphatase A n=1 Tax=Candidatus Enterovibrio escicola TaxID=1927127 RepID=UPI001237BDF2|nr:phosphatidylglycerophosphatase A [Candidatus Enterovibrio escacola]
MNNPINKIQLSNPVHLLATGFGLGLSPFIPGTIGTLAGLLIYLLIVSISSVLLPITIMIGSVVGIYLCGRTAEDMSVHDHGSIVWDEFIGFWITMLLVPVTDWQIVSAGFIIFRFFDMIKPWPICLLDTKVPGGLGIMLDDIVAGLISMVVLWAGNHYLGQW